MDIYDCIQLKALLLDIMHSEDRTRSIATAQAGPIEA